MPRRKKVWIDEDGDGKADAHGEVVVPEVDEVVEDIVEDVVEEPVVEEPVVVPKKKKVSDAERRRKRHMGF
jgi:hypothetical protein